MTLYYFCLTLWQTSIIISIIQKNLFSLADDLFGSVMVSSLPLPVFRTLSLLYFQLPSNFLPSKGRSITTLGTRWYDFFFITLFRYFMNLFYSSLPFPFFKECRLEKGHTAPFQCSHSQKKNKRKLIKAKHLPNIRLFSDFHGDKSKICGIVFPSLWDPGGRPKRAQCSNQCIEAVKKAQKLLGYIKRQFRTRNKETILTLYNALVRPHLEYAVQFWSPSLRKDIERLEAVQARATKLIPSIRHLGYVRRLERLNLYSLEKRRLRGQLIETFKMLKGVNNIDYRHLFTFSNNRTRSNGWKLELKRFNTSQCGNFFTYKIAPIWNRLPAEAVNSASVEQFKIELDKVIDTLI